MSDMSVLLRNWNNLYHKPTRQELALEGPIAALGFRYRFQHPVWGAKASFLDYYWPDLRVAVEIDGAWGHSTAADKKKDRERTARLDKLGILVVRVTNGQVDTNPTKTAQAARARAEKLRESRPLDTHPVGTGVRLKRTRGVAATRRKGVQRKRRKTSRARTGGTDPGNRVRADVGQGGPGPSGPPVLPDAGPYDPAGEAWGDAGVLVLGLGLNPDFAPR